MASPPCDLTVFSQQTIRVRWHDNSGVYVVRVFQSSLTPLVSDTIIEDRYDLWVLLPFIFLLINHGTNLNH
jgi:hypothetical protein